MSGSTARPSVRTQPSAMCVAPIAYERSTTSSSGSPASTRTVTRAMRPVASSTSTRAPASAPSADRARVSRRTARRARRPAPNGRRRRRRARPRRGPCARRARPRGARFETGGPGTRSTRPSARRPRARTATRRRAVRAACGRGSRRDPSRYTAVAAIGGRFGPEAHDVLTGVAPPAPDRRARSASSRAASGAGESDFRRTRRRWRAGSPPVADRARTSVASGSR